MKVRLRFIAMFFLLVGSAGLLTVTWTLAAFDAPGPLRQDRLVYIHRGSTVRDIAALLSQSGMIKRQIPFLIAARLQQKQGHLKAGEYMIPAYASVNEIIAHVRAGRTYYRSITIVEGLTSAEILAHISEFGKNLTGPIKTVPSEGTLLPDTYHYSYKDTRARLLGRMKQALQETLDRLWEGRAEGLPFDTKEEAIVLASIVEKETGLKDERARVAGVFVNRLKIGMMLQSDPTVIYAHTRGAPGGLGRALLRKDMKIDSPYNTYKYTGLPPGPIANPGKESIAAVLQPEEHDYLYFVADGTGGHAFAKTLKGHNKNAAAWRKIRDAK